MGCTKTVVMGRMPHMEDLANTLQLATISTLGSIYSSKEEAVVSSVCDKTPDPLRHYYNMVRQLADAAETVVGHGAAWRGVA